MNTTTINDMKLMMIDTKDIKTSPFNPPVRTNRKMTKYRNLVNSIKTTGLINPVTIAHDFVLIDGNRRLQACRDLNITTIPAVRHNSNSSKMFDKLFVQANEHTVLLNAAQELYRYLKGAEISQRTKKVIENLKEYGGLGFLYRISDEGKSPNTYNIALSMYRNYTKRTSKRDMKKLIYWMLNVGSSYQIKKAMADYIPIDVLVDSVENMKKLKTEYTG